MFLDGPPLEARRNRPHTDFILLFPLRHSLLFILAMKMEVNHKQDFFFFFFFSFFPNLGHVVLKSVGLPKSRDKESERDKIA